MANDKESPSGEGLLQWSAFSVRSRARRQVWEIVRALAEKGTTIVLCTQYLDEAEQLADRIAVIDHGNVIAEGTAPHLEESVGPGALRVRVADPAQAPDARRALTAVLRSMPTGTCPP